MWLFTTLGFYSVVQHKDDAGLIVVRARALGDLERLADRLNELGFVVSIDTSDANDYPHRIIITRDAWNLVAATLTEGIDYPDFKSEVKRQPWHASDGRYAIYTRVWSVMHALQRPITDYGPDLFGFGDYTADDWDRDTAAAAAAATPQDAATRPTQAAAIPLIWASTPKKKKPKPPKKKGG